MPINIFLMQLDRRDHVVLTARQLMVKQVHQVSLDRQDRQDLLDFLVVQAPLVVMVLLAPLDPMVRHHRKLI